MLSQGDDYTQPVPTDAVLDIRRKEVAEDIVVIGHDGVDRIGHRRRRAGGPEGRTDGQRCGRRAVYRRRVGGPIPYRFRLALCDTYADAVESDIFPGRLHEVILFLRIVMAVKFCLQAIECREKFRRHSVSCSAERKTERYPAVQQRHGVCFSEPDVTSRYCQPYFCIHRQSLTTPTMFVRSTR